LHELQVVNEDEAERADIAAHLHDSVLQTLTLIRKRTTSRTVYFRELAIEPEEEMQLPLDSVEGLDESVIAVLQEKGLHTQEDLADLSVDELMTYTGMNQEQASALILKAREPWFRG